MRRFRFGRNGAGTSGESESAAMAGRSRWRRWAIATLVGGSAVSLVAVSSGSIQTSSRSHVGVRVLSARATNTPLAVSDTTGDIHGFVYDTGTTPLQGICVTIDTGPGGVSPGAVATDSTGSYTLSNLAPGPYKVLFENNNDCGAGAPNPGNWAPQWYHGQTSSATADAVEVTAGNTTSLLDTHMTPGGAISGRALDADTGTAINGVCVLADLDNSGFQTSRATTDVSGAYRINNLASGSYVVRFNGCPENQGPWIPQAWESASLEGPADTSTLVAVTAPDTTANIDAALVPSATITGTVSGNGSPLRGICVSVDQGPGGGGGGGATTGDNGVYTMTGLVPGKSYVIRFDNEPCGNNRSPNPGSWVTQWYNGTLTGASSFSAARPVLVPTTTPINATMAAGGSISGTVTGDGAPQPWSFCASIDPGLPSGEVTQTAFSGQNTGTYTLNNVAAGNYRIRFTDDCTGVPTAWVTQWYNNSPTFSSSTPVTVTAGNTTSNINADLVSGAGSISGTVTAAAGRQPLRNICVHAHNDTSGLSLSATSGFAQPEPTSTYVINGLSPGSYTVTFDNCDGAVGSWVTQSYNVTVASGANTPGVDAAMVAIAETHAGPGSGPHLGGTLVTISGSGFTGATAVTFDGIAGTNLTVISDSILQVRAPKHVKATVPVIVSTPSGSCPSTNAVTFTYT